MSSISKSPLTRNSQASGKELEKLKQRQDRLSQFIIRMSKCYEGVNPAFDKELNTLRSHLGGNANFALAEVSMNKLNGLIMQHGDSVKHTIKAHGKTIDDAFQHLLAVDDFDQDLVADISKLQSQIKQSAVAVTDFPAVLGKALAVYKKAVDIIKARKRVRSANAPATAAVQDTGAKIQQLHDEICLELRELIDQLSIGNKRDEQLKTIKNQLIRGIEHEELLASCLVIIKAIIRDVIKERRYAEKFVSSMHRSLSKVNRDVSDTLESSADIYQQKTDANQSLRGHIEDMEDAVETSTDLNELKGKATEQLQKMASSLDAREQADKDEQLLLMNLLNQMSEQLSTMEKETADYKKRLLVQKQHSHHDPLTQVPNRTAYNERIELEFRRWSRNQSSHHLSIAVVDVDHFKSINDNYGHAAGDKTLQVIAQNISKCLRSTDFVARWGGEEFVLIFPDTQHQDLIKPLEMIRQQISKIPFKFKEQKVTITVSSGGATFGKDDSIETVFERADEGLYEAKNSGRNRSILK